MNFKKAFINTTLALSLTLSVSPLSADAAAFEDTAGHWADGAIQWAKDNKIANGYPDGTFKPDNYVTEEEFMSMLINAFEYEKPTDVIKWRDPQWSDGIYEVAYSYNYPFNRLDRLDRTIPLKRYRVAELVAATQGKNYSGDHAIQYVMGNGLASGKVIGEFTIASFKGYDTLTRAEAASFIMKLRKNTKTSRMLLKCPAEQSPINELPHVDKGKTKQVLGPLPTTAEELKDSTGRINIDAARKLEMAVHDSYKFGSDSLTVTLPKVPKGYALDVQYYVEYKDGTFDDLGQQVWLKDPSKAFIGGGSYTMKVDWSKVGEAYLRVGLMDTDGGAVRRYSYYQYSTKEIVEKVKY